MTTMKKKILIADDAAFNRMMLKDILKRAGYEVEGEAPNGKAALDVYKQLHPDLTIMDITMPEMNGVEALKRIKELEPKARVIICSAMGQQAMVAQAIQCGAKDFIVKPFEEDRLIASVDKIMSRPQ